MSKSVWVRRGMSLRGVWCDSRAGSVIHVNDVDDEDYIRGQFRFVHGPEGRGMYFRSVIPKRDFELHVRYYRHSSKNNKIVGFSADIVGSGGGTGDRAVIYLDDTGGTEYAGGQSELVADRGPCGGTG